MHKLPIHVSLDTQLIDHLRAHYAIDVQAITPLAEGADIHAATYKAHASDHLFYFVKLKYGNERKTPTHILSLLDDAGVEQIISPIKTIHGHFALHLDQYAIVMYPFIEGKNGFTQKLTHQQWTMLGKAFRRIHEIDIHTPDLQNIRHESYSSKYRQAVRALDAAIQQRSTSKDQISQNFLDSMREQRALIHTLINQAEELCNSIKTKKVQYVLCHSDIHAGNVLIQENGSFYIVDWDEPIIAPKERDLMFIGGGVGNAWNIPEEEVAFYQGYGSSDINLPLLAYYRCERIIEDIAEYAEALLIKKPDDQHSNRLEMYTHFIAMFEPNGVVDIALKTYSNLLT